MSLYTLGALRIEVAPFNVHDVSESGSTDFAVKGVVGAEQPLEYVGEGSNEVSLSGRLFPFEHNGLDELETLRQMRVSGKPQYLMRGDGVPLGYFAIMSVSAKSSYLHRSGIGKQIDVSISLRRAQAPAAAAFFALMQGLL